MANPPAFRTRLGHAGLGSPPARGGWQPLRLTGWWERHDPTSEAHLALEIIPAHGGMRSFEIVEANPLLASFNITVEAAGE